MQKILYVEDDLSLIDGLKYTLENNGYFVDNARTASEALARFKQDTYDLLLLDVTLPDGTGFDVCKEVRAISTIPIIFLTASDQVISSVRGLDIGADDYITKPFNILELKARIRALLRRANAAPQQKQPETLLLTAGGITLDPEQRVAVKNGEIVELTAKEYDLIELLVKNPRRVYSRENLMDLVWGYTYAGDYRTVDVHIRRLREKLEENPAAPQHILTKWGVGYYFRIR